MAIIYTTILKPVLRYESQIWSMKKKIQPKIGSAEIKVLRILIRVIRKDRIRNESRTGCKNCRRKQPEMVWPLDVCK